MYGATATSSFGQDIEHDLETLRRNIDRIGTTSDSKALRQSIKRLRCELKRKISNEQCSMLLQNRGRSNISKQQRAEAQRLTSYIERLNRLMEKEKTSVQSHPYSPGEAHEEPDWGGAGTSAMPLLQRQRVDTSKVVREAQEVEELMRDMQDLNQIYQDVARLVVEQGEDIDNIETNVGLAHSRAAHGARDLGEAARLTRFSRRKKLCICLCVLVAVGIPLILAILAAALVAYFLTK